MRKILLSLCGIAILFAFATESAFAQGVTTASINGVVTDTKGEALPGATVIAVHKPSGSQYGNVTGNDGYFRLSNMRVGGPYEVTVSFVGYEKNVQSGINLSLGQSFQLNIEMKEETGQLSEVIVRSSGLLDGNQDGQKTVIDERTINDIPTITRSIGDFARFNPLANITEDGDGFEISLGGQNNRYNTIYIDGAVNNDAFGLAGSGTNGGQTGVNPISIDAIEQFTVALAPFDVRQSGFAGGAINAVTRSGTNEFEGSAYTFYRNEKLAGFTPTNNEDVERERLDAFTAQTSGFRLGGPIIKDKVFFFVNGEIQRDETPQPFNVADYQGNLSASNINNLASTVQERYGYDVGGFADNTAFLNSDKILAKIDWNINKDHKLSIRHSYTGAENLEARRSSARSINFINGSEYFISKTNSSALELNSMFGNNISNKLVVGATIVRDDRDPFGADFPTVELSDGDNGSVTLGAERFSTANLLNQDVITINNDLEIYKGRHTFTIGANFEYFSAGNLFIRNNFGRYRYFDTEDGDGNITSTGVENFLNGEPATQFERSFSQVDNVTGDDSEAIAAFRQMQVATYFQDEIQVNKDLKVTAGIRFDLPIWPDVQPVNEEFNNNTIPLIEAEGYDMRGAETGKFIKTQILVSPRVGFNWDVNGSKKTQLRGGAGIFTSRLPLVWPGGAFNNYGFNVGEFFDTNVPFNPDVNSQEPGNVNLNNPVPSGQIDLFAEDFKLPQVYKINLAVDQQLPWGIVGTFEGIFTGNINAVRYQNLNLKQSSENLTGTPDDRPIFPGIVERFGGDPIDGTYSGIYLASNTSKGYSYNLASTFTKGFTNGFSATASYAWGDSYSLFDGTSSQNSSQWRGYYNVEGRNNEGPAFRSTFASGHRVMAQASYEFDYLDFAKTKISLFYNSQSGRPYTYVLGARNFQIVDDGGFDFNELMYVPESQADINLVETEIDGQTYTPAQQWEILNDFIENDPHLSERRGQYNERNGRFLPMISTLDLRILQDFYIKTSNGKKNTLQLSLDVFNFTNMINPEWGRSYFLGFGTFSPINFRSLENGTEPTYSINPVLVNQETIYENNINDSGFRSSRWQAQIGIRYIFGN